MINYKLAANYTIFVPDGSGWKQRCSGKLETSGSEAGAGSKNDCDYLTDMLGAILIKQLFPYKSALNQNKLETTIKNTSQVAIKKLTLSLPPSAKYLFQMVSWASTSIAPGEEKKVEFPVTTANMQNGVISEIDFESRGEAASPATAKSPQPSRAPMTSKTSCKP
jgi:hypothetical protein